MSMTKIQKELLGALIGLARSVDGRGEAAKGESQEFSSGDSNGHRPDKATHEILLGGICAANPEKELREEEGKSWIVRVEAEKNRLNPDCAVCKGKCGRTDNYDLEEMETDEPSDPLSGVYKKPRKQGIFCVLRQVHKTYYRVFTKFCKSRQNCRQALATEK